MTNLSIPLNAGFVLGSTVAGTMMGGAYAECLPCIVSTATTWGIGLGIGAAGGLGAGILAAATYHGLKHFGAPEPVARVVAAVVYVVAFVIITGAIGTAILGAGAGFSFAAQLLIPLAIIVCTTVLVLFLALTESAHWNPIQGARSTGRLLLGIPKEATQ